MFHAVQVSNEDEDVLIWPEFEDEAPHCYGAWDHEILYCRVIVSGDPANTDQILPDMEVVARIQESLRAVW